MGNEYSCNSDTSDSDRSHRCAECDDFWGGGESSRRSPSRPKKPKHELKYNKLKYNDESSDDEGTEIYKVEYDSSKLEVKYDEKNSEEKAMFEKLVSENLEYRSIYIEYCYWGVSEFSESDLFKEKGFVRSDVYRAGDFNEFQFYFVMEKMEADDETHLGVYVCVLSNVQFEGTVNFKSYLHDSRGKKNKLIDPKKQAFPRKPGFRFLGSMCKESIMGDERSQDRYVQDDNLDLCFKITGYYKTVKSDVALDKLLEDNKVKDITLVVKGEEFPANRAILMARSPTFATLLNKKKDTTKLQIKDVDPDIMKQLLLFIYTGYVSKLFTHAKELSAAADKYELKDLKDLCKKLC